ncbi:MAG: sialate O-acetylesterase [Bacteroidales bacterium]
MAKITEKKFSFKKENSTFLVVILSLFLSFPLAGQVKMPRLISDGMVLQRNAKVKIWGWAGKNENITLHFLDSTYKLSANDDGNWLITISTPGKTGPFEMQIKTSGNSITIHDILLGDVWVCSGQSNMELPMSRVSWVYPEDIANSENAQIRYFSVPQKYNFNKPEIVYSGGSWIKANPENVMKFSAVSWFFAKELFDKYKVPIGIINASVGGSPIEAWMSEGALQPFQTQYNEYQRFKDSLLIKQIEMEDKTRIAAWYNLLWQRDTGNKDSKNLWYRPEINVSDWAKMKVPGLWNNTPLEKVNGVVWFRRTITIPSSAIGKKAKLILGRIVDADSVYMNGIFIGTTGYQYPPRRYDIPPDLLKEGENTIVVRVISNAGVGGFVTDKPYQIITETDTINLQGDWQFRIGAKMEPLAGQTFVRWKPVGLYNAMISPLLNYAIKGVAWYQGESNAERPMEYRKLLPALVNDWRNKWKQGNFPFLVVQLPNFMESKNQPSESNWALMRESQQKVLDLPATGLVVTYDLGEWNDIHPLNKKDVGIRLALAAQNKAYGESAVVFSGPVYKSMKRKGNKIILSFTNMGSGLKAKFEKDLKHFAIAGSDRKFIWARAKIENNQVIVWHENIKIPVAVRYAWADNPEVANLYNKEGLPASPFRTDDW